MCTKIEFLWCFVSVISYVFRFRTVFSERPCVSRSSLGLGQCGPSLLRASSFSKPLLRETVLTTVNVSLVVNKMRLLRLDTMDMEFDLLVTQKWYDERLAPDDETRKLAVMGAIWKPRVTFTVGSLCANDNDLTQFWRGTTNGSVLYSERSSVKLGCTDDLRKYPFDSQKCVLKLGSYRFTMEEVNLTWDAVPVAVNGDVTPMEFHLQRGVSTYHEVDVRRTGNFSVLVVELLISRNPQRVVTTAIVPSGMLILVSYLTFWLKLSAVQSRIFLSAFSMAGLLYFHIISNDSIALVSYFKALDIWFAMCSVYILLSFVENILVYSVDVQSTAIDEEDTTVHVYDVPVRSEKYVIWLDKTLRLLYPAGFLSCAILFFVILTHH